MPGPKHTAEQIVRKLRTAGVELAKGLSIKAVCKKLMMAVQVRNGGFEMGGSRYHAQPCKV
jgi:hypothetical protein